MALTIKNLGIGTLPSTAGTIVPGSTTKSTLIKYISLVNTSASAVTVNVWLLVGYGSGSPSQRLVSPQNFEIPAGAQIVLDNVISLRSTSSVGGFTVTAIADRL